MKTRATGFTLIELMVAVVIISLLAAVAIPSYRQYVVTSQRDQAKSLMLNLSSTEERYYTNNYTYYQLTTPPPTPDPNGWQNYVGSSMGSRTYDVSISGVPPINTNFTVTASPSNGFKDPQCGILTLTNAGLKGQTGTGTSCW